jgi:hypothetical protein
MSDGGSRLDEQRMQRAIGQDRIVIRLLGGAFAAPLGKESCVGRVAHARQHDGWEHGSTRATPLQRLNVGVGAALTVEERLLRGRRCTPCGTRTRPPSRPTLALVFGRRQTCFCPCGAQRDSTDRTFTHSLNSYTYTLDFCDLSALFLRVLYVFGNMCGWILILKVDGCLSEKGGLGSLMAIVFDVTCECFSTGILNLRVHLSTGSLWEFYFCLHVCDMCL